MHADAGAVASAVVVTLGISIRFTRSQTVTIMVAAE